MDAQTIHNSKDGAFKFVRVRNEYRFCACEDRHDSLVQKGEEAVAAGTFFVFGDVLKVECSYSSTLRISAGDVDWREVCRLVGKRLRRQWE